ncbi:hypothetical protein VXJ24_10915, partial [Olsenella sp. YH-ols2221]|uniref:hypothetical protein n=1 Tax=Olsenella kribbiana TaxID=3115221 RepID=UPI002ED988AA
LHDPSPSRPPILRMHQPFIHMMQRSGDRNSCGYAGGPQPFYEDSSFLNATQHRMNGYCIRENIPAIFPGYSQLSERFIAEQCLFGQWLNT